MPCRRKLCNNNFGHSKRLKSITAKYKSVETSSVKTSQVEILVLSGISFTIFYLIYLTFQQGLQI